MKPKDQIKVSGGVIKEHYDFLMNGHGNIRSTKIFDSATAQELNAEGDNLVLLVEIGEVEALLKKKEETIKSLTTRLAHYRLSTSPPRRKPKTILGGLKRVKDALLNPQ